MKDSNSTSRRKPQHAPPLPEVDEVDVSLSLSVQVVAATPALLTVEALRHEQEADQELMAWVECHRDAPSSRFQPRLLPVDESDNAWCDAAPSPPWIRVPSALQRAAFVVFHQPAHPRLKSVTVPHCDPLLLAEGCSRHLPMGEELPRLPAQ